MRIGVDGRALRASREPRGVAVYLERMLSELVRLGDEYRVAVPGEPRPGAPPEGVEVVQTGGRVHASGALAGRPGIDALLGRPDVVWIPAPAPVAVSPGALYVLTVHDLSFEHRPRDFSAYERLWHRLARLRRLASRATFVMTDTEAVRGQLLEEWRLTPERVRVVRPGPGRAIEAASRGGREQAAGDRHVLAVGALEPRKLPLLLARAHELARSRGLRARLVFAGDGPLRPEVEATGATVLRGPLDAELDEAYAGALCLACVSREEGFGFTPLEGIAAGLPPVVSDLPVFAETVGDAALRVPVGDAEALAEALLRLEREPELRARLVEAGRARLRELSWERAARETRALFAEAAA
jgi:glycosyltransferase involved in cell wall biosynthesis